MRRGLRRGLRVKEAPNPTQSIAAIRLVALFEAFKGLLVLVGGSGLLLLVHKDVHALAVRLIEHSHLNPASRYPEIFLDAAGRLHDSRLVLLALGAAVYAAFRLVEAYGLYRARAWAEWLAVFSGALYVPIEVFELQRHVTALRVTLLLANLAVVAIMVWALRRRRQASVTAGSG
jgi:uncharacterized membrane protein (DUF2068 family)